MPKNTKPSLTDRANAAHVLAQPVDDSPPTPTAKTVAQQRVRDLLGEDVKLPAASADGSWKFKLDGVTFRVTPDGGGKYATEGRVYLIGKTTEHWVSSLAELGRILEQEGGSA